MSTSTRLLFAAIVLFGVLAFFFGPMVGIAFALGLSTTQAMIAAVLTAVVMGAATFVLLSLLSRVKARPVTYGAAVTLR